MLKKVFYTLINVVSVLIIIGAVGVLIIVLMTKPGETPSIGGYMALRVTTGSMAPTYDVDTLIVVKKTDPSKVKEGDVISFYSSDPALNGAVNTHRVVAVKQEDGHYTYQTKGDGNNAVDPYEADGDYLLGTVVASSLFLGKLVRLVSNPLIFIPIIIIPLVVMLFVNLIRTISYAKKIAKEEEEAAVREMVEQIKEKKTVKEDGDKQD
ncbi:MAG: signal peptidase I [Coprococcus sp.]|nr:signal peptidase I [Coprococcus sp.]